MMFHFTVQNRKTSKISTHTDIPVHLPTWDWNSTSCQLMLWYEGVRRAETKKNWPVWVCWSYGKGREVPRESPHFWGTGSATRGAPRGPGKDHSASNGTYTSPAQTLLRHSAVIIHHWYFPSSNSVMTKCSNYPPLILPQLKLCCSNQWQYTISWLRLKPTTLDNLLVETQTIDSRWSCVWDSNPSLLMMKN